MIGLCTCLCPFQSHIQLTLCTVCNLGSPIIQPIFPVRTGLEMIDFANGLLRHTLSMAKWMSCGLNDYIARSIRSQNSLTRSECRALSCGH